jgi:hypothetical protein
MLTCDQYTDGKQAHQVEVANTIVLLVIEAIEGRVMPPSLYSLDPDEQIFACTDAALPATVPSARPLFYQSWERLLTCARSGRLPHL